MQSVDGRIELCKTHIKTYIDFKFFIQMLLLYRQLFIYLLFVSKRRQKKKKRLKQVVVYSKHKKNICHLWDVQICIGIFLLIREVNCSEQIAYNWRS